MKKTSIISFLVRVVYLLSREQYLVILMVGESRFYKGLHQVKVVTESEGYWIVEALEDFEDFVDDERIEVKAGERRIVPPETLHKRKALAPPIPEHIYERQKEKQ